MPSLFDMFRGGNQQQEQNVGTPNNGTPQNQGGPNPGNIQDPNNAGNRRDPNANVNDPNDPSNKKPVDDANKSPLADFAGLWDDAPAPKDGQQVEPNWDDHSSLVPRMKIDPKRLIDSARRIDFSKAINPERAMKALKEGDVGAFNEVMNSALQASFANQAMTMSRMAESMFSQFSEKLYSGALPHHFRKHTVNSQISQDLPILNDPAVAPMFEMFKSQLTVKYPKASAQEISQMAQRMVRGFADAVVKGNGGSNNANAGKTGGGAKNGGEEEMDWLEFANGGPQQ